MEALHDTGLPPTTPRSRRPWSSSRAARTSRASSTTSPGPARSTTAGSSTRTAEGGVSMARPPKDDERRPPVVRRHDLRRPQEHDLRRPQARRPPGQGRLRLHRQALHRRREPRAGPARACSTTTRRSPRPWPLLGKPTFTDAAGKAHDWRADLAAALAKRQEAERELGQPRRPLHGRRPRPRHRLRPPRPGLRPGVSSQQSAVSQERDAAGPARPNVEPIPIPSRLC